MDLTNGPIISFLRSIPASLSESTESQSEFFLTDQQIKIIAIAQITFGCIAALYCLRRSCVLRHEQNNHRYS